MISIQADFSRGRLACLFPLGGTLQSVADRIAHDVSQRLGNCIQQALVQVGFLPTENQFHLLVAALRRIPHNARKTPE